MRSASAALIAFLQARLPCFKADLFTFTLADGSVYRWTDFDQKVVVSGNTFLAQGPQLTRTSLSVKNTIEVPELQITLSALDTDFIGGANIKTQIHNGAFDGAKVTLERAFMPTPGDTSLGPVTLFSGRMSQAKITALGAELTVKGDNVLMNQYVPRNLYQTSCVHRFCDPGCTLLAASFTITNTVGVSPTKSFIPWGSVPSGPANYTRGVVTFTSGPNAGAVRTVKLADATGLTLMYPLYELPAAGDAFSVLKGCDKTLNSGSGQSCTDYANTQHFRAFPFVPVAEEAI